MDEEIQELEPRVTSCVLLCDTGTVQQAGLLAAMHHVHSPFCEGAEYLCTMIVVCASHLLVPAAALAPAGWTG